MNDRSFMELGLGKVMHARTRPNAHRFLYPVFCLRIPVRALAMLQKKNNYLFAVDRPALLSFFSRDHGDRSGELMQWLTTELAKAGMSLPDGAIWLQTMPRVLGYGFNPVSFWYMHDSRGALRAILAEVNNTFGEHHQYLLCAPDQQSITEATPLICRKEFHVSPFCRVGGHYRFRYCGNGAHHRMEIDYFDEASSSQPLIATAIAYRSLPATDRQLWGALCRMPFLTLGVMFRIHVQALKLWMKKTPFYSKPVPPPHSLTSNKKEFRQ
ncbi:MAG: DUF1365 domain-containing protein [Oxalicibacterium faecigallinarum]|uniref:DUF1365 domain-containing protein n=1 Tax=Oxalicibacterium faecigallinarum TaxID=573741 RepID=UPI002809FF68|nr:DUF1365 domain-containing protein [Oxalicibacterium faecigallinarum]MDQ7970345.1 DUF1365 domain-containing protein [Oxalicibacterium faecigallinarum]